MARRGNAALRQGGHHPKVGRHWPRHPGSVREIHWGTTMADFLHHYTAFESTAEFVICLLVVGPPIVTFLYFFIKTLRDRPTLEEMDYYNLDRTPAKLETERRG
jgi:hypothetical protein